MIAIGLVAILALQACALLDRPTSDPVIDTWPIGRSLDCAEVRSCDELIRVGLAGLDDREPDHPEVIGARLHAEGAVVDPSTGGRILMTRSGACCQVLVIDLEDGTTRAIGVGYPGISQEAIAIPWETVPEP